MKKETVSLSHRKKTKKKGAGLINKLINKLPVELHIPSYQFCGPGTKLKKRLARGDKGINKLDEACKEHDIAYSDFDDLKKRHEADNVLAEKAFERIKAPDSSLGEKLAAIAVTGIMKAKTKLGSGMRKRRTTKKRTRKRGGQLSFNEAVNKARRGLVGKRFANVKNAITTALSTLKKSKLKIKEPKRRIIPVPKTGGILPLIPIFAGLSALGALSGGAASIANAVNAAKNAQKKLIEQTRHNKVMEKVAIGKGLYLQPYKKGCGLYLKPSKNC